jgi:hypothetical protein
MQFTQLNAFVYDDADNTLTKGLGYRTSSSTHGRLAVSMHLGKLSTIDGHMVVDDVTQASWVKVRDHKDSDLTVFINHDRESIEAARVMAVALWQAIANAEAELTRREEAAVERHQGDMRVVPR